MRYSHSRFLIGLSSHWLVQHTSFLDTDGLSIIITEGGKHIHIALHVCCVSGIQYTIVNEQEPMNAVKVDLVGLDLGVVD